MGHAALTAASRAGSCPGMVSVVHSQGHTRNRHDRRPIRNKIGLPIRGMIGRTSPSSTLLLASLTQDRCLQGSVQAFGRTSHFGMRCGTLNGMSTQIAVRLPDEMVAFLDRSVATGRAPSRAALVASAVEREMRRLAAEQDAEILRAQGAADDLDALVEWTGTHAMIED